MTRKIVEPSREIPVSGACEVLVAGGGVAGVAAAVAARRQGASVCLLEKASALGGLATLGNVVEWLPICDGRGRQVIGGLGEELLRLSAAGLSRPYPEAFFRGVPSCWAPGGELTARQDKRFQASFNPASYLFALEKLLVEAGVELLYDTRLCAVKRGDGRLTHAIVENKSGRQAVAADVFIDATGDADLCHLAGEATESLASNVLCGWFYYLSDGALHLCKSSRRFSPELTCEGSDGPFFRGDDGRQVSEMIIGSRNLTRECLAELKRRHPEADIHVFAPWTMACFRATRRLVGAYSLGYDDVHHWFDDAIGLTGSWRESGPVWAIPWRCLQAPTTRNLAVAGRCISSAGGAWDITRAIPGCVVTGEAAGTAAGLAVRQTGADLSALSVAGLQKTLRENGVLLDPELVKPI